MTIYTDNQYISKVYVVHLTVQLFSLYYYL